jgi:hypothetical protein
MWTPGRRPRNRSFGETVLTATRYNRVSMAGLGTHAEIVSLQKDAQRLIELKDFLAQCATPSNRRRIAEIDDELNRVVKRLAELEQA